MELLKKLDEICQKDSRQDAFCVMDLENPGPFRPLVIEDFYRVAESIRLHDGVPGTIRDHFQTARNLIIYSWFYYPFNMTAQLCAYTSVEYALKYRDGSFGKQTSFSSLLKKAVAQGWISDAGFSVARQRYEMNRRYHEQTPELWQTLEPMLAGQYCAALAKAIPFLRNDLAHGSSMLMNDGVTHVRICAELINQLFEPPKAT